MKNVILTITLGVAGAALAAPQPFDARIKNNTLAISPDEKLAAVAYSDTPRVLVYDLGGKRPPRTITDFVTPRNILFSPDGARFYVSDSSLGEVLEFDAATLASQRRFPVGAGAFGTALTRDGRFLYVNNEAASTVTVLDLTSGSTRAVLTGFAEPRQGIRISPDNSRVYVTNFGSDQIMAIDTTTYQTVATIGGFKQIRAISLTRDGRRLFAANSGSNTIAEVEIASARIIRSIPVGRDPFAATLAPDERHLLTGSRSDNTLDVVDLANGEVVRSIGGFLEPRQAIVYSRDGKTAYVLNKDLSISVVDLDGGRIDHTHAAAH